MKPLKAWVVVHSGDGIDCWDYRVPVYWDKRVALEECKKYSFGDSRLVRVEIRKAGKKRG